MPASAASCVKGWALKGVLRGCFWPAAQGRRLPAWQRCGCSPGTAAPAPAPLCGACGELWLGAGAQGSCHTAAPASPAALGSSPACPRRCWQAARPIRQALSAHISFPPETASCSAAEPRPRSAPCPQRRPWLLLLLPTTARATGGLCPRRSCLRPPSAQESVTKL